MSYGNTTDMLGWATIERLSLEPLLWSKATVYSGTPLSPEMIDATPQITSLQNANFLEKCNIQWIPLFGRPTEVAWLEVAWFQGVMS